MGITAAVTGSITSCAASACFTCLIAQHDSFFTIQFNWCGTKTNLSFSSRSLLPLLVCSSQFVILCAGYQSQLVTRIKNLRKWVNQERRVFRRLPDQIVEHGSCEEEGDVRVDVELRQELVDRGQLLCVVVL